MMIVLTKRINQNIHIEIDLFVNTYSEVGVLIFNGLD